MRRDGFTLVEALIACAILYTGMGLLWDGYLMHQKLQVRLESEVDALNELASVSELLSRDAETCKARPSQGPLLEVALPTGEGVVRWRDTARGLEREGVDHKVRVFKSLRARELAIETLGTRMLVLARLRGPADEVDTVMARIVPIGSKR